MSSNGRSSIWWIIGGSIVGVFCCLCLAFAGAFWFVTTRISEAQITPTETVQLPTQIPVLGGDPEEMLRLLSETIVPLADPVALAERLTEARNIPRVLVENAEPVPVGTVDSFWVSNIDTDESFTIQAEMVYATDHVYFWIEQGVNYELAEVKALVDDFEQKTYPTVREFFGSEWTPGVDGDEHLYILYASNLGSTVAGYYGSNDEYSPLTNEYSNGHEMFYISSSQSLRSDFTYGVLAHEFQHMIHWFTDPNEQSWVNEGFSELASLLTGHGVGFHDLAFTDDPDQTLSYWPSDPPGASLPHYGQGFLFMAYTLSRFGPEVTQALVAHPANGIDSVDEVLREHQITDDLSGELISADEMYRDWAATLLLQDPAVSDGRYAISAFPNSARPNIADTIDQCPTGDQVREVHQYGIDYIQINCTGELALSFSGVPTVRVLPAEAHSGSHAMWTNKGDTSAMSLRRAFDLREVSAPIALDFWIWYDIEENWDYLYLTASTDGGETWQILKTPSGTDFDPQGNNYGWAYTGFSGGGTIAQWIRETVNLSAFAGSQVLLQFDYVTDAAVNGEGALIDDLSIRAIDYAEDFEDGLGGWEPAGFVRLFNVLPQHYLLALVEVGEETRVTPIMLDDQLQATQTITLGEEYDEAYLIVIGATRHTWRPAPYQFSISR